jgi:hypothetical protein
MVLGGGEACGDKPLAFVGRSTRLLSGQDPLVSDLVGAKLLYAGLLDGYSIAIYPFIRFSALSRLNKRDNF